jgi:hypothetical protein
MPPIPIPTYLIVLLAVCIVLPSIAAVILRFILYRYLAIRAEIIRRILNGRSPGRIPRILVELEENYKEASNHLEQVNSGALIDRVYSQEKVLWVSCEQIDYFCRILPNLLLSFGLLGTFLGITINLSAVSETISQTQSRDFSSLLPELQKPLQGMGIAFVTSLIAIGFSVILTLVNFLFNTGAAKHQLLTALEDYLDNVYQPSLPGRTRIDKGVDRLVNEFSSFLYRFGDTVRDAVERSLGENIQKIVDLNQQSQELAIQVYSEFKSSSSTIARSADELKYAITAFENAIAALMRSTDRFEQASQTFERTTAPQKLLEATTNLTITQHKFSESVRKLSSSFEEVTTLSQSVRSIEEEIGFIVKTSEQFSELYQINHHSLNDILIQLQKKAQNVQSAVDRLDGMPQNIGEIVDDKMKEFINDFTKIDFSIEDGKKEE